MELRGFDSYEISLGDEMRGERASLGKSLADVERDMRIKARIIRAIEDCDLSGFPNQSVISGYVRSYARYLGLDGEACFQRFCTESGYQSPASLALQGQTQANGAGTLGTGGPNLGLPGGADQFARSRFAPSQPGYQFRPRISLGAITSACALFGLIGALSYGGYALLQDIQRVGFAPLPQAPTVVVDAPAIGMPDVDMTSLTRPDAGDYLGGGVLAEVVLPTELAAVGRAERDGPISAIDPADAGLFQNPEPPPVMASVADGMDYIVGTRGTGEVGLGDEVLAVSANVDELQLPGAEFGVVLLANEDAWIRVRGDDNSIVFEGILGAGDRYDVPDRVLAPRLRAGNAGGLIIYVDGVAYGPVGERGRVASDISLRADDIRSSIPQATPELVRPASAPIAQQRAEVGTLTRQ